MCPSDLKVGVGCHGFVGKGGGDPTTFTQNRLSVLKVVVGKGIYTPHHFSVRIWGVGTSMVTSHCPSVLGVRTGRYCSLWVGTHNLFSVYPLDFKVRVRGETSLFRQSWSGGEDNSLVTVFSGQFCLQNLLWVLEYYGFYMSKVSF